MSEIVSGKNYRHRLTKSGAQRSAWVAVTVTVGGAVGGKAEEFARERFKRFFV